jgi:hypothetical protein
MDPMAFARMIDSKKIESNTMSYHLHHPLHWAHNVIEEIKSLDDERAPIIPSKFFTYGIKQRLWKK